MIQITISTQDHRGKFIGTRSKRFYLDIPEVEKYLRILHDQGWTEEHSATIEIEEPVPEKGNPTHE